MLIEVLFFYKITKIKTLAVCYKLLIIVMESYFRTKRFYIKIA
ncbi:Uncharacterised protein [Serratia liquefaciens]|nr:Uncharacterised protein [Serratia liquefaciens]